MAGEELVLEELQLQAVALARVEEKMSALASKMSHISESLASALEQGDRNVAQIVELVKYRVEALEGVVKHQDTLWADSIKKIREDDITGLRGYVDSSFANLYEREIKPGASRLDALERWRGRLTWTSIGIGVGAGIGSGGSLAVLLKLFS